MAKYVRLRDRKIKKRTENEKAIAVCQLTNAQKIEAGTHEWVKIKPRGRALRRIEK